MDLITEQMNPEPAFIQRFMMLNGQLNAREIVVGAFVVHPLPKVRLTKNVVNTTTLIRRELSMFD